MPVVSPVVGQRHYATFSPSHIFTILPVMPSTFTRRVGDPFNVPGADLIIRSEEKWDFAVYKEDLKRCSRKLAAKLATQDNRLAILEVIESKVVWWAILLQIYPDLAPPNDAYISVGVVNTAYDVAKGYEMDVVVPKLRKILDELIRHRPLYAFDTFVRQKKAEWRENCRQAAYLTLEGPVDGDLSLDSDELLPGGKEMLRRYRDGCKAAAVQALLQSVQLPGIKGARPCWLYCGGCKGVWYIEAGTKGQATSDNDNVLCAEWFAKFLREVVTRLRTRLSPRVLQNLALPVTYLLDADAPICRTCQTCRASALSDLSTFSSVAMQRIERSISEVQV
ncbi:unnamed protein product [Somion occarium]|uniref:Uncharacterized protein n=1 Tax=Somion occarium TaxID=3059160 RepID=A0ABP1E5H8_9APHY